MRKVQSYLLIALKKQVQYRHPEQGEGSQQLWKRHTYEIPRFARNDEEMNFSALWVDTFCLIE